MEINQIIEDKLRTYPHGFAVDEVEIWLQDIPVIYSFSVFKSFLERENMTPGMWFALMVIIRNKYINTLAKNTFDSAIRNNDNHLNFQDEKSAVLNLSALSNLTKAELVISKKCETIILPEHPDIEFLEIVNYSKLEKISNIEKCTALNFLAIRKCNHLDCFDFVAGLNQLLVLDISMNKNIHSLKFLENNNSIRILQLIDTHVMKLNDTVELLSTMKKISVLDIKANRAELTLLREKMPYCSINGQESGSR